MRILLLKTLRDLRASWAQTLALTVVVMLGVGSYAATVSAYRDLNTSYNRTYDELHFAHATFSVKGAPERILDDIRALEGVEEASGRLVIDTGLELPERDGEKPDPIRARLIGLPAPSRPAVNDILVLDGRYFDSSDDSSILLDTHFAEYFKLGIGDSVSPILNGKRVDFPVSGIATSPEYLMVSPSKQEIFPSVRSFGVFYLSLKVLQDKLGTAGVVNDIAVRIDAEADEAAVVERVQETLAPFGLSGTTLRVDQPSNAGLSGDIKQFREIAYILPMLILLVAAISVYVMLGRQILAHTPQIGLMKALGYSNSAVMGHYLLSALFIGLTGSILGALQGIPLGNWITDLYAAEIGIPIVETRVYPELILEGAVLSLAATMIAAIAPARGAARLAPAQAMRFDPAIAQVRGRISLLERILPLPLGLRLPVRSVFRVRRRSLTTALGIVFAYILVLMVVGLLDSIENIFFTNFETIERWDISVVFQSMQPPATLETVRGWDGVKAAEPILQMPVTLKTDSHAEDLLLTAFDPGQEMHMLKLPKGVAANEALADGKLVVPKGLAEVLELSEGDRVTLETPFGQQEFVLGPFTDEMMTTVAYLSMDEVKKRAHASVAIYNGMYLTVDDARAKQIKFDLYHLPDAAAVQRKADLVADLQGFMGLFYLMFGIMLAIAAAMAFSLLFNTMTVNVLERKREFATMRSIGSGTRRIAMLLFSEIFILWILTLAPGLLLGYWTAVEVGKSFSADLFSLTVVVSPNSYVFTAAGVLLTMLLATLPAIRQVSRLNLAEATKVLN